MEIPVGSVEDGVVGAVGTVALGGRVDSIFTGLLSRPVCRKNIQEAALGDSRKSRLLAPSSRRISAPTITTVLKRNTFCSIDASFVEKEKRVFFNTLFLSIQVFSI